MLNISCSKICRLYINTWFLANFLLVYSDKKTKRVKTELFICLGRVKWFDVLAWQILSFFVKMLFMKWGLSPENVLYISVNKVVIINNLHKNTYLLFRTNKLWLSVFWVDPRKVNPVVSRNASKMITVLSYFETCHITHKSRSFKTRLPSFLK